MRRRAGGGGARRRGRAVPRGRSAHPVAAAPRCLPGRSARYVSDTTAATTAAEPTWGRHLAAPHPSSEKTGCRASTSSPRWPRPPSSAAAAAPPTSYPRASRSLAACGRRRRPRRRPPSTTAGSTARASRRASATSCCRARAAAERRDADRGFRGVGTPAPSSWRIAAAPRLPRGPSADGSRRRRGRRADRPWTGLRRAAAFRRGSAARRCGSCWAFASTGALSDRVRVATGGRVAFELAPQALLDCGSDAGSRARGDLARRSCEGTPPAVRTPAKVIVTEVVSPGARAAAQVRATAARPRSRTRTRPNRASRTRRACPTRA